MRCGFRHCRWAFFALSFSWAAFSSAPFDRLFAQVDERVLEAERKRVAVVEKIRAVTLAVFDPQGQGGGSGVVISPDGYALTNFHVVVPCGHWMRCGMVDGRLYNAVLVGLDPGGDVALIKLLGRDDFPVADLGDSDRVRVGDWAFAVGNPFLLATDFRPTVTYGVVSGVHRYQYPEGTLLEYADCIQTDAAINPGNSGGPLFDSAGRLIGINGRGSFEKRGRVNVGVGYAISINQIKKFLGCLRSGRIVDHATLGATVSSDADGRVTVDDLLDSSDAYRRGLRYDDEIVYFGDRLIRSANDFKNALGVYPKGWRVPIEFRRGVETFRKQVRLAGVHRESELIDMLQGEVPANRPEKEKKPGDGKPGDQEPKDRPIPREIAEVLGKKPKPPAEVTRHYEERRGFANYYFNRQNRNRVWTRFSARGDFRSLGGAWKLAGKLDDQGKFEIMLDDRHGLCDLPVGATGVDFSRELGGSLDPPGSGGLLVALHLWRRMLVEGPDRFGQTTYWGSAPLAPGGPMLDVLSGVHDGLECRFWFEPIDGRLVAVETFIDDESDPCELRLRRFAAADGRETPREIEVRHGDRTFGVFHIESVEMKSDAMKLKASDDEKMKEASGNATTP
jgi:S1-C subfamily serine protease